jgi:hypothetical protein
MNNHLAKAEPLAVGIARSAVDADNFFDLMRGNGAGLSVAYAA